MKESGENKHLLDGKQYCLVSGLLINSNFYKGTDPNINQERKALYKALAGDACESKKKLVEAKALLSWTEGDVLFTEPFRIIRYDSCHIKREFQLIDEIKCAKVRNESEYPKFEKIAMKIDSDNAGLKLIEHIKQGRQKLVKETAFFKAKYKAHEGSSLTLLGLVKFDKNKNRLVMSELTSIIAGGIETA